MYEIVKTAIEKEIRFLEKKLLKVVFEIEERPPLDELGAIRKKAYQLINSHQEKRISDSEFLKKIKPLSKREGELKSIIDRVIKRNYPKLIEKQVEIEENLRQLRNQIFLINLKNGNI